MSVSFILHLFPPHPVWRVEYLESGAPPLVGNGGEDGTVPRGEGRRAEERAFARCAVREGKGENEGCCTGHGELGEIR